MILDLPRRVEKGAVKAPLKGELSAQLTEGFRLGLSQASPKANTWLGVHLDRHSASSGGFSRKSRNPSVSAAPSQLPLQGSLFES